MSQPSERPNEVEPPGTAQPAGRKRAGRPPRLWELLAVVIVKPLSLFLIKRRWRGGEQVPRKGGLIIAANHLSWSDPVLLSHFLYNNGRWPVILAKAGLFKVPFLGHVIAKLQAVPVARGSTEATQSLKIAEQRLRDGACVLFYPEGTITRDPDMWPMIGKTGAARLALATGVPVIPVAHWGAQELLPYGEKKPRLFPRKRFRVQAGPPVDLSKYAGLPMRGSVLREATADIMAAITAQLAEIRDEKAPEVPYDPKNAANG
ncbi:1-acyl-sn-glycerol-3-phosphate acyltransferase [Planotetraspora sp. A-T 1434]|uniref:lysophospholipid acyltransferase family protein n=1 Tax=Planotetraspora sp. A-T 1434 TaxID=2979219 RepID=UPI0021BF4753|nr:lysophospholipid acyltransferase family protein [Planotetraspora sp. A-T 1434]MCT9931425.1 1-acyl-sn-glycerol-3-phosphate acyltransferase [Planotetraspora sp. A-T 1434]